MSDPLLVYVVFASNHYTSSKAMAVRLTLKAAKHIAEKLEPDMAYSWRDFADGAYVEGGYPGGPQYSYSIETVDVGSKKCRCARIAGRLAARII